jgi:DNA-binding MarR family transcriptional regulator
LIKNLNLAMRELSGISVLHSQAMADRLGLNSTDLESLDLIAMGVAQTPGDLMKGTGLTSGAVTGVVDRLERKGFVVRQRDSADRRKVLLKATDRVQTEAEPLGEGMRRAVGKALNAYDDDALEVVLELITDLLGAARAAVNSLQKR